MKTKKLLCLILLLLMSLSFLACSESTPSEIEKVDTSKTQLYVYNFYGGYGSAWLAAAKARFEEAHADDVWEEGKKGVQILITNEKEAMMSKASQVLNNKEEVYFSEKAYLYTLKDMGVLADITEAVTTPLTEYGESRSIADKLTEEQKAYWGIKENGTTKYYGIPHYSGYYGLNYNVDLFDKSGYYFAKEPVDDTLEGRFINKYNPTKSAGPDGVEGTYDDGLPSTYAEFFTLCEYIRLDGNTPIIWAGSVYKSYLTALLHSLYYDYEGLDEAMLNYTLQGVAHSLVTVQDGQIVFDEAPTTITDKNGYELTRQAGRYYALEFLEKLLDQVDSRLNCFNTIFSHLDAQETFLWSGNDGKTMPIAMLSDGIWWESEASETFRIMSDRLGPDYTKENRKFAFMPLPKATEEKYEETKASRTKTTLLDHIFSICFVKANIAEWKKPLALEFVRFVNTNESLAEFTTITNTIKALDYTMTEEQLSKLTNYGRSLFEIKQKAAIIYPYSSNPVYVNNQSFFSTDQQFITSVDGIDIYFPPEAMKEKRKTAIEIFEGTYEYYKNNWIEK